MRYLVKGEFIDPGPLVPREQMADLIKQVILPSLEGMAQLEKKGKARGGVLTGARAGVLIVDAASHEALTAMLRELPFWGLLKWEVTPLDSFRDRLKTDRQLVARMKESK
jgi:muconolactone delta-isomerase